MSSSATTVRAMVAGELPATADVLARAFHDDPVLRWFLPPRDRGGDRLGPFFRVSLEREVLPHGEVHVAERDGAVVGAALWRRPGEWDVAPWRQLRDVPRWLSLFGWDLPRAARGLEVIKAEHPAARHWYLSAIGVDPAAQGHGVGGQLLSDMLRRCDAEAVPAYLESSKAANLPLYQRHGFAVRGEPTLPNGPTFWPMWRDPAG